ncbi:hypothetical protein [Thiolapillus sp.]
MNKVFQGSLAAGLLLFVASSSAAEPFHGKTAQVLCGYMEDLGIPGTMAYRDQGKGIWSCDSARKKLPQGEPAAASDLQYRVIGNEHQARKQVLELRMRSYRQPQGVLKVFSRYVDVLLQKTLGTGLSDDMYQAIMAPREGEWQLDGHVATLRKLRSKGSVYDLKFTLAPAGS